MKIIRVVDKLSHGGVQRGEVLAAAELVARGHEVLVLCTEEEGELAAKVRESGARVDVFPMRHWRSARDIWRLSRLFRRERPDVVHSHKFRQNIPATFAAWLARVPKIFAQVHSIDSIRGRGKVRAERIAARLRTGTIVVSESVAADVRKALAPWEIPRLHLIYNGIETERFACPERKATRAAVREEFGLPPDSLLLFAAGRLSRVKNQEIMVKAMAALKDDFPMAHLLIAGEGDRRELLQKAIERHGLEQRVVLAGLRNDVPRLLCGSDIYVLSSNSEGFSYATIEAMASGIAIVHTDVGGAREALHEERNGLIVPPGDVEAFTAACRRLLENEELRHAMADNNRADAERFSLRAMIDRTLELYSD
ncbi:glycosyltransferase [bacterium]|nr:glycosyltransferase [bacterium]